MKLTNYSTFRYFNQKLGLIILIVLSGFVLKAASLSPRIIPDNTRAVHQWVEHHFGPGIIPPFSFVYGTKKSSEFIKAWKFGGEKLKPSGSNTEEAIYTYSDPKSGFVVKCIVTCFTDFPEVEWVLKFSNTSGKNTPIIEMVNQTDISAILLV